jgi:heme exporter protein B
MMDVLVKRDVQLLARNPGYWLTGIIFFVLFLTLCAVALGGQINLLRPLSPAFIWLSVIFSCLLAFGSLFQSDYEDGSLEQLMLTGTSPINIVISKMIAFSLCAFLPLLISVPAAGIGFGLPPQSLAAICLSLLFAAPAIMSYGALAGAILVGRRQGSFLSLIITAPFLVPLLIFGIGAVDNYSSDGLLSLELQALAGLSLIGCAVGIPAASAALSANLE